MAAALALGGIPALAGAQPQPQPAPDQATPDQPKDDSTAEQPGDQDQGAAEQDQGAADPGAGDQGQGAAEQGAGDQGQGAAEQGQDQGQGATGQGQGATDQGQGATGQGQGAADQPQEPVTPTPPEPPTEPVPLDTAVQADVEIEQPLEGQDEVIVVTGSVIERRDLTTPAPVAIVNKETLDASGLVSVGDILQNLPSQSNAINVQFNNSGNGSTRISLRGLGPARTLVLVNGRRHVPGGTGADASVDLNAIPVAIIERVEVLKDGASAIYGSDAIGGVVNIITRKNFEGTETSLYLGSTHDGLAEVLDVSVTTGINSKKGNVVFAVGYYDQRPMFAGDREYSKSDKAYDWETGDVATSGSTTVPQGYLRDRLEIPGNEEWDTLLQNCPSGICYLDPDDGWRDFNDDGNSDSGDGDLYNYQPANYLVTPQRRYNVFVTGDYDFGKHVKGFFEASYTNRASEQKLAPTPLTTYFEDIRISAQNRYNTFGRDLTDVRRRMLEAGTRNYFQKLNTFRFVGGVEGTYPEELALPKGWRWSLSYNYGRTEGTQVNEGRFIRSRVAQALGPSYRDETGWHCGTVDNPGDPDCVPLNLLGGEGTINRAMLNYISYTGTANGFTQQKTLAFNTTGKLFNTPWGGDVALAVGMDYRQDDGEFQPDPVTASGDTTGNKEEPTKGGYDVYEAYGELSVVPVVGKELAEWVEINAAVRGFDYSSFGSGVTWKAGGLWRMIKGVSLRGTYSTAFRAPSIGELYDGRADSFPRSTDPCDTSIGARSPNEQVNCARDGVPDDYIDDRMQLRTQVGGNDKLEPETANIFTAGAVYEPAFLPGFAVTVDYFDIEVENAIQPLGTNVILSNCYDQQVRTNCDKVIRDPNTHVILNVINLEDNIGGAETAGVDFNFRYDHTTNVGRFRHNLEGTWLQKYNEIGADRTVVGKNVYDLGVYPDWKFNFSTIWGLRSYGGGVNMRFINGFKECEDNDCSDKVDEDTGETVPALSRKVSANFTADIFGSYTLKSNVGTSKFTVGINNVLNQEPAVIYNGFLATSDASTYDYMGRYFYARFAQTF